MDRFLEGKLALVTGGTRGIGWSIAEALGACGAAVAICGRSEEGVAKAVEALGRKGVRACGCKADVANPEDVRALFEYVDRNFGGLDILVNNAGVGLFGSVGDMTPEAWRQVIGTNLDGAFYCAREAVVRFRKRGGGFVVNIGSLAGKNPFAGGAAYNASKFGMIGFSEAMMLDHRYDNIRVSVIMPGSVNTDFGISAQADWKSAPEDIAEAVLGALHAPARTMISRVEIRPSKPKK